MALSIYPEQNTLPEEIDGRGWLRVTEIAMLTNPTAGLGALIPTLISAFVARGTISLSEAVLLGAAEMAGMTLILFCAPFYINRYNHRVLAYGAAALAASGQLLSLFVNELEVLKRSPVCGRRG